MQIRHGGLCLKQGHYKARVFIAHAPSTFLTLTQRYPETILQLLTALWVFYACFLIARLCSLVVPSWLLVSVAWLYREASEHLFTSLVLEERGSVVVIPGPARMAGPLRSCCGLREWRPWPGDESSRDWAVAVELMLSLSRVSLCQESVLGIPTHFELALAHFLVPF